MVLPAAARALQPGRCVADHVLPSTRRCKCHRRVVQGHGTAPLPGSARSSRTGGVSRALRRAPRVALSVAERRRAAGVPETLHGRPALDRGGLRPHRDPSCGSCSELAVEIAHYRVAGAVRTPADEQPRTDRARAKSHGPHAESRAIRMIDGQAAAVIEYLEPQAVLSVAKLDVDPGRARV